MTALTKNKFLSDDELQRLLTHLNKNVCRDTLLLKTILFTGARGSEVLSIQKKHVGKTFITIFGKKGSENRDVQVPQKFIKELQGFISSLKDDDFIFAMTTRNLRKIWDNYRPNPNLGVHCLRHTFGVKLYKNSKNIHTTKYLLGHKNIKNTMVYLDYVESAENLRKSIKGMWAIKNNDVA